MLAVGDRKPPAVLRESALAAIQVAANEAGSLAADEHSAICGRALGAVAAAITTVEASATADAAFAAIFYAAAAATAATGYERDSGAVAFAASAAAAASDAASIAEGRSPRALRDDQLWGDTIAPDLSPGWASSAWSRLRSALDPAEGWQVWIDWYEARLRGDPYDEGLEECYVLIAEEIWAQGPAVANAEIARRIAELRRKRHAELLERIAVLEARLETYDESAPVGIGHNNPPEPLEQIWPALEVLQSQPVDAPDLVASQAAASGLREVLSAVTGYVGSKLDVFIDEAVKSCGKRTGDAVFLIFASLWAGWLIDLAAVVDAVTKWLATFGVTL